MSIVLGVYSQVGNGSAPALPLLLDVYTGAAAAYSLRKIAVATTNVVKIRRSDNVIQDFTANEITDGTLSTWAAGLDAFVSVWYDQSGNGNNATQATALSQTKLVSAGVVITDNGKPSIQFDSSGLLHFNMTTALSNIRSVFYTLNPEIAGSAYQQFMLGSTTYVDYAGGASQEWLLSAGNSQVTGGDNKINGITTDLLNTTRALNQTLVSMIHTASTGRADSISNDRTFSGRGWLGKMQELVIYSTDESSNQVGIRNNINTHYSIYTPPLPFAFGNALDFDGVNDYVSFGGSNNLAVTGSAWTAGSWLNMDGFVSSYPIIMRLKTGVANNPFAIFFSSDPSYVDISFGSQSTFAKRKATIPVTFLNSWIHVAISYNGAGASTVSNFTLYINGTALSTTAAGAFASSTDTSVLSDITGANAFSGKQDEVSFWQQELTPAQIANQYNGGLGNNADIDVTPLVWFKLNESGTATTAVNSGSGGVTYDGTLNNFPSSGMWVAHTPSIDPDAQAYITAGSITDATEIAAINQMFLDLKGTGSTTNNSNIYSKFFALYPISPTGLAAGAVNAVSPATYDITWFNSPTYGTTGVTGNASNMYGSTNFNPSTHAASINDFGITMDVATTVGGATTIDMGAFTSYNITQMNITNATYTAVIGNLSSNISGTTAVAGVRTLTRRAANDAELYLNGITDGAKTTLSGGLVPSDLFLMGRNDNNSLLYPSARRYRFFAIHKGLTSNEAKDLSDTINTYNANVILGGR